MQVVANAPTQATITKIMKPMGWQPSEYSGPGHIVSVSKRPDGRCNYEERPGPRPPNQSRGNDENVMTIFFVRAQETAYEIRRTTD